MIIGRCETQPVLLTSALVTLLFCWMRRLTTPGWSYLLALIAAFCTMLWPYAYIGLEVEQSLALLLAAYLGLTHQGKISWSRSLLFALSCAVAVSVKMHREHFWFLSHIVPPSPVSIGMTLSRNCVTNYPSLSLPWLSSAQFFFPATRSVDGLRPTADRDDSLGFSWLTE